MIRKAIMYVNLLVQIFKYWKKVDKNREDAGKYTVEALSNVYRKMNFELKVSGKEHLLPTTGNMFIVNHQANMDIASLLIATQRGMAFIAKEELKSFFGVGHYISAMGGQFINRDDVKSQIRTINALTNELKNGLDIAVFPEGTRSRSITMGEFKHGTFKMALKAKCPIIPVALHNSFEIGKKGLFKKQDVYVSILEPIYPSFYENLSTKQLSDHIALLIQNRLNDGFVEDN